MIRALSLSLSLVASPALAVDMHISCKLSASKLHQTIERDPAVGGQVQWARIENPDAQKIVAYINAVPPETDFHADYVDVSLFSDASVSIFFVSKDCVTFGRAFSGEQFVKIYTDAVGSKS